MNCHVHIVLCDENDAALGGEMCLEAIAVVEIRVVRHRLRKAVKGGNALICLRFRFLGHAQLVHEIPTIRPELAAQDVLVEEIRGFGTFDRQVDVLKRSFLGRLVRRFEGT